MRFDGRPGSSRMRALRFERRRAFRAFQPHSTAPSRRISDRRHFEYGNRRDRPAVTADRRHGRSRTVSDMPVRALLTTGPNINASSLGPPPANVAIEAWVPQGEVWPHATAFLCHGGSGTLLGGLAEGLPVVVLPLFADQPLNGRNVEAAGAGLALLDPDAASLRSAIERVLVDGGMRTAARRIADEMAAMHSIDEAIDELECVARRQNVG